MVRVASLTVLLTAVVWGLWSPSPAAQQPDRRAWREEAAARVPSMRQADQPDAQRVRPAFAVVDAASRERGIVLLPLPTGRTAAARLERREEFDTGYVASGPLTDGAGSAAISVVGSTMAGHFLIDGQTWVVRQQGQTHTVSLVDESTFAPDGQPLVPDLGGGAGDPQPTPPMAGDGATVDVMVVYTPAALARYGSVPALTAETNLAIANANTSLANANVAHRFRLVHFGSVSYTESGNAITDLERLRGTSDGFMDGVHATRNSVGADVVSLLTTEIPAVCGIAYVMDQQSPAFAPYAFSVVVATCAAGNLTLAHEIGHNMGLQHNVENAGLGVTSYAYGYRIPGVARTVMAYECPNTGPPCPRTQVFSSPLASFSNGSAAGVHDAADNARALNLTFGTVAAFRADANPCSAPGALTLGVSPSSFTWAGGAGNLTVTVSPSCTAGWTVVSSQPWLTFSSASTGTTSGNVSFSVAQNTGSTPAQRSAIVTLSNGASAVTVTVAQSPPTMTVSPAKVLFGAIREQDIVQVTPEQEMSLAWSGPAAPQWSVALDTTTVPSTDAWLTVPTTTGTGTGRLRMSVNVSPALVGHTLVIGRVRITASGYATLEIPVALRITAAHEAVAPNGRVDLPVDGASGLSGALAMGGWALDDIGVARVEIHRVPVASDPPAAVNQLGLIYLANAVFVSGARPDVLAAFGWNAEQPHGSPNAQRAGWGVQVLTNALPHQVRGTSTGGQGTFTLVARAVDLEGRSTELGRRTITVDNDSAVVPFGSIDTPIQGGLVPDAQAPFDNPASYPVFGWALSPGGACINPDGSTIDVLVDGVVVGQPTYGLARSDIATKFPGYCNSAAAVGVYYLNATGLSDGLHTLEWRVRDNLGRVTGIGSRHFRVSSGSIARIIDP